MKALVTGASGFLGGRLVHALRSRPDTEVAILVRRTSNLRDLGDTSDLTVVVGDLTDPTSLRSAVAGVDVVFHCAARVDERGTSSQFWDENVRATENLMAAAREAGAGRFVFVSSPSALMAYDGGDQVDIDESTPYPGRYLNLYCETKAAAERAVLAANAPGFVTCALRPRAIWGPGDRSGPIVKLLARTYQRRLPDLSYGRDVYASLCHVDNIVDACLRSAVSENVAGKAYFIADAEQTDIWPFLGMVAGRLGCPPPKPAPNPKVLAAIVAGIEWAWKIPALATRHSPPLSRYAVALMTRTSTFDTAAARRDFDYRPVVDRDTGLSGFLDWVEAEGGIAELAKPLR